MRRLWAIIRTDFKREFISPGILINYLVLPLIFTLAVSAGLGAMMGGNSAEAATPIAVVQQDTGVLGSFLVDMLPAYGLSVQQVDKLPEKQFGLVLPADFSEQLMNGKTVAITLHVPVSEGTNSLAVQQAVEAAQSQLVAAVRVAQASTDEAEARGAFEGPAARQTFFQQFLAGLIQSTHEPAATTRTTWSSTKEISGAEQASAGQLVTWVQITLLGACGTLVIERMGGTLNRLLASPTSRATILGGKLLARFLMGMLQLVVLLASGALLFHVAWAEEPLPVALISVALGLAIVGLALFVATLVKTMGQAIGVVNGLAFGLAALGGAWWPLEITPPLYQQLVQLLPTTWAMRAYTEVLTRSVTLADVLPEVGILLGFAVFFFALGVFRFRRY